MTGSAVLTAPPSGEQFTIEHGAHAAVITEVGATLRTLRLDDLDIVDGFSIDEMSSAGRGQVLAPWPNRLEDGRYSRHGLNGAAALDEPERMNAIHGLVRWAPWQATLRTPSSVTLACVVHPQPGYPWRLAIEIAYVLADTGLVVTATATNASTDPAPFGIGFHPYLTLGTPVIDALAVSVPAGRTLTADTRGLPTGERAVEGSELDFRTARPIGATRLDTAFTDLRRGTDDRAVVEVRDPGTGTAARLWVGPAFGYLMIYTGDTLEPVERRRKGIAIEPMTCPPNALRTGVDLIDLEPHGTWTGRWGIERGGEA